MATNADDVVIDDKPVTENDLRELKYGNAEQTDETDTTVDEDTEVTSEEIGQTEDQTTEGVSEETPAFTKEFAYIKGETPEEYARNLEQAYKNSTSEALRLKKELDKAPPVAPTAPKEPEQTEDTNQPGTAMELWAKQKLDEEIQGAFDTFRKDFPQVTDQVNYDRFTKRVAALSKTILLDEKRLASPGELYAAAAASFGWQKQSAPDAGEKLTMALKDNASASKVASTNGKSAPASKVTQRMIELNRKMYPGKTDQEIRDELEPYVQ